MLYFVPLYSQRLKDCIFEDIKNILLFSIDLEVYSNNTTATIISTTFGAI